MPCPTPIIVALDFPDAASAIAMAERLNPAQCRVKVGKELFTAVGPQILETLQHKGFEVFLDLKFHDIPNTTAGAVRSAAELGVWMVNVHASGGRRMMEACREVLASRTGHRPLLTAVTVLTSLEQEDLQEVGIDIEPMVQVQRLARLTQDCGLDGWCARPGKPRRCAVPWVRTSSWLPPASVRRTAARTTRSASSPRRRPSRMAAAIW